MAPGPPPTQWQGNGTSASHAPLFSSPRALQRTNARPADLDTAAAAWKHVHRLTSSDNKQTDLWDLLQSSARESQYSFQPPGVRFADRSFACICSRSADARLVDHRIFTLSACDWRQTCHHAFAASNNPRSCLPICCVVSPSSLVLCSNAMREEAGGSLHYPSSL